MIEESVQPFATAAAAPFQPTAPEPIPAAPEPDFVAWHEQRAASGAVWEEEPVEEDDDGPTPHSDDDDDDGLREKPGFRLASDPSIHWRSGSKVSALDKCNVWCDAVVTDERGQGSSRQLRVHYSGWNKRFDEWLFVSGGGLRAPPRVRRARPVAARAAPLSHRASPPRPASHYRSRHRHPCLTFVRWRRAAPRPPARRAPLTRFSTARAVRDDTVSPAPPLPAPPAPRPAAALPARRRRRTSAAGAGPSTPGFTQAERRRPAAEAAAAAEASAEAALHRCCQCRPIRRGAPPPRRLHAGGEAASFDRCGTFGCILADRHPGLHIFEQAAKRQRPAKKEPVEEEAADPGQTTTLAGSRENGRGRGREA